MALHQLAAIAGQVAKFANRLGGTQEAVNFHRFITEAHGISLEHSGRADLKPVFGIDVEAKNGIDFDWLVSA